MVAVTNFFFQMHFLVAQINDEDGDFDDDDDFDRSMKGFITKALHMKF